MIRCLGSDATAVYELTPEELDAFRQQNSARLWVDLSNPTEAELAWLGRSFALQSSNLNDVQLAGSPDYVEVYPSYIFGSGYHPQRRDGELYGLRSHFFLAPKFLITIQGQADTDLGLLWQRYGAELDRWRYGLDQLWLELLQLWQNSFTGALADLQEAVRRQGDGARPESAYRLLQMRREFSYLQQLAERQQSLVQQLGRLNHPGLDANIQHRLQRPLAQLQSVLADLKRADWWTQALLDYHEKRRQSQLLQWLLVAVVFGILSFWLAQLVGLLGLGG
ncbi:MAG: hypothetical protein KDE04_11025 [Anaerolineales bacterium]|nr:hypothetical protein [Anaerolineales bacterium]